MSDDERPDILLTRADAAVWDKLKPLARQMRHEPTPAEDRLWQVVRRGGILGCPFRRQHPIERFIADFFCYKARLVVEIDGAIHDYTVEEDALRTAYLEHVGLKVIRFPNAAVLNDLDAVVGAITAVVAARLPRR